MQVSAAHMATGEDTRRSVRLFWRGDRLIKPESKRRVMTHGKEPIEIGRRTIRKNIRHGKDCPAKGWIKLPKGPAAPSPRGGTTQIQIRNKDRFMLGTILIVVLVLMLIGVLPTWGHSRSWGYLPSGSVGLILLILLVLVVTGRL